MFVMRMILLHPHRNHPWNLITSCSVCPRVSTKVKTHWLSHICLCLSLHTHYCLSSYVIWLHGYYFLMCFSTLSIGLRKTTRQSSLKTTEIHQNHQQQHHHQKPKTINLLNERSSKLSNTKKTTTKLAISLDSFTNLLHNSNTDDDVLMITKQIYNNAMQQHHNHTLHNHNHNHNVSSSSSPSSLGGRDVEPQPLLNATTSHMRRFELEI